jgi:hypothetical protein
MLYHRATVSIFDLNNLQWVKHSSLFQRNRNDEEKSFIAQTPGRRDQPWLALKKKKSMKKLVETFTIVIYNCECVKIFGYKY